MKIIPAFLFAFFIIFYGSATCQDMNSNAKEWAKKLADPSDSSNHAYYTLDSIVSQLYPDSAAVFKFINSLATSPLAKSPYFIARYNCLKAKYIRVLNSPKNIVYPYVIDSVKTQATRLLDEAMKQAYITDDPYLIAFISAAYGGEMVNFQNTEKAMMYMMNSADLYDTLHLLGRYSTYLVLGEMLWRVREYAKSIKYAKIAILLLRQSDNKYKLRYIMMCNNTVGLAYHRLEKYDSAFYYYNRALELCSKLNDKSVGSTWEGIVTGNMAQIDFVQGKYTTALPIFEKEYQSSKEDKIFDDAGNALQWAAKTNLALGNKEVALRQVRESFNLLKKWPTAASYRQNAYLTASEIFKALGRDDSAFYYSEKYDLLHDSLERVIYQSSISISKLRLDNERDHYNIQNMEREKKAQLQSRNFIIAAMFLLSAIALLLINRQRQKAKIKAHVERQEKRRIEQEMEAAREQLNMFTRSIVEKTNLIDKLESQMENKLKTEEQQQLIEELGRQTILTDDDWLKFKNVFRKLYPDFFNKLNSVNNITPAEQRMTALTLLHLTTKQMAAVLGISPNSVIKAKQRMRNRFNLQTDQEIEDFILSL